MWLSVGQETGIARNLRVVEWLKADLVASTAAVFRAMAGGSDDKLVDALAGVVITCYVLARRLGIGFSVLDLRVEAKLRQNIDDGHEVERWYGDLSSYLSYFLADRKR
jgi:hypothetical protein